MNLLAIETSSPRGSIAICIDGEVRFFKDWQRPKGRPRKGEKFLSHSEMVGMAIEEGLKECDLTMKSFDHLLTSIGPGSFTGIRVGLAAVKSFAFALDIPCYGYTSLQVLAEKGRDQNLPVLTLVNAYKNQVYAAAYKSETLELQWGPEALPLDQLESRLSEEKYFALGDGLEVYREDFCEKVRQKINLSNESLIQYPNAAELTQLHLKQQDFSQNCRWTDLNPLYLRASEAEEKLQAGLLKPVEEL
tara:strand:- start:230436 stop:231176 length:741 start_codon:yes stop_codon:yes gene_type:complete